MSKKPKVPSIKELSSLVRFIKKAYVPCKSHADYKDYCEEDSDIATVCITVGADMSDGSWSWQSGSNEYTGGAYGYRDWAVVWVSKQSNARELARDIQDQLYELTWDRPEFNQLPDPPKEVRI